MATSANSALKSGRSYRPTTALAKSVEFSDEMMHVSLTDGRVVRLSAAGAKGRALLTELGKLSFGPRW